MRYPTVKRIACELNVDNDTAKRIRGLMDGSIDPETSESVQRWLRQCYHRPNDTELKMCAIDDTFETHGVEAIMSENGIRCRAAYCNTGDTYCTTILFDYRSGTFKLTSWGDFVEAYKL